MNAPKIPIWKKAPFIRMLLPLMGGIIAQWYVQFTMPQIIIAAAVSLSSFLLFYFFPLALKFKAQVVQATLLQLLILVLGLFITWQNDIRNQKSWLGKYYTDSDYLVVKINEPLTEKQKSFKAEALVEAIAGHKKIIPCQGKIILYFSKDSLNGPLQYGDKILIHTPLQEIKNSGNPGAFNYERYAAFQQTFHNVFLKPGNWRIVEGKEASWFRSFIFNARSTILKILKSNIKGINELGVAEALLIGYKEDLDKDLVQAYSNTGVVHIIAISGLHLGLIYVMLVWIFNKIPYIKRYKIIKIIFILLCLWLFSILTGASASVLRSAVMFTCIIIGEKFSKKSSIYNSLAASAFLLLCYNPYFLWDVGFQLSYLAVLGIVIFQQPIYRCLYVKNKWVDKVWQLVVVSLAAQLLTFPVCIYYFHQFPNLFLLTNLIAVPLSSIILFIEIFLLSFAWVPGVANFIGKVAEWLIWLMNKIITTIDNFPFALWDKIPFDIYATWLLYGLTAGICAWLMHKKKIYFKIAVFCLLIFCILCAFNVWKSSNQKKLIVYNVPRHQAIDIIQGKQYKFIGDTDLLQDGVLQNFHLKPSRIKLRLANLVKDLPGLFEKQNFYRIDSKTVFVINQSIIVNPGSKKLALDCIIISKNANIDLYKLNSAFDCKCYVFDASNSLSKIEKWKSKCSELHLSYYSVPERGAFEMDL